MKVISYLVKHMMNIQILNKKNKKLKATLYAALLIGSGFFFSCQNTIGADKDSSNDLTLPAIKIDTTTAIITKDYMGSIEGKINVELRPQVEGILQEIYVDEGDYVKAGQPLFKIDASAYNEIYNNALANENVEKAKLKNAKLEIDRLKPLIDNEVIAPVQLEKAKSDYEVAKASLAKASAAVGSAQINVDFTVIKASVSGYIGRIPKRVGNLVSKSDKEPLTYLSDVSEVYVYFAMSESDFLHFSKAQNLENDSLATQTSLGTLLPNASLILADGIEYKEKGKIDAISGQINKSTGAISLRASFPNSEDLMRSGNTGTIKIQETRKNVILIPQEITTNIQDKTFVHLLNKENKVILKEIKIDGIANKDFIVSDGLKRGDVVIKTGFNKLSEGMRVIPQI
ncbi:membrane fusion protein, multidrug efflux system [Paenimyroides aquimaris]|uniref:Membrane fusion protein, multidrug efflux system n=1 Tax=Paenimyroides marinum TaxID=1159016 RepID=A0A1H6KF29_9FLAO|nr:membrane fusion protein, multidrug efflux system [Paenimyroides aquimaris]